MTQIISRRLFNTGVVTGMVAAAVGSSLKPALAQVVDPRPPMIDTSQPVEIADGVFVIRDHRVWLVPNIAIILGRDAALVVDTGLGPENGERLLTLARQLAGSRRLILTTTHFHPEHGYGAQVFRQDATIVYNRAQRDELVEKGENYIDLFKQSQSAAAAVALDGTKITMPHFVYDGDTAEIELGNRIVQLRTWGTAHTRGDQIVFLPKERILFTGDLLEQGMFPIFPWFPPSDTDVDAVRWVSILKGFKSFDPTIVVPGHGDLGSVSMAFDLASHIETVGREVGELRKAGKNAEEIIRVYKPQLVERYPKWDHPGLIDWELNYFSAQPV